MSTDKMVGNVPEQDLDRSVKILLVDDVELFLELEKTFFRREDIDLLVARNGEDALALIARDRPDLVFLDLYMPGINGDEVCRKVKQDKQQQGLPIVMVIQSGSVEDERRCRDAGCTEILYKPVRRADFIAAASRNLSITERVYPRIDASIMVSFGLQPKKYLENFSVNISVGGIYIATGAILTVGTQLNLEFRIPERAQTVRCLGQVAWVNHPDWLKKPKLPVGMGIEFVDAKPKDRELLRLFVDQNTSTSSLL